MHCTVVGIESIAYTRKDGSPVEGVRYHLTSQPRDPSRVAGVCCDTVYVSARVAASWPYIPSLGDVVRPVYDARGHLEEFLQVNV